MPIRIPESEKNALARLINLPLASMEALVNALRDAKPELWLRDLAEPIAGQVDLSAEAILGILRMLANLYLARTDQGVPIAEFVDEICSAANQTGEKQLRPPDDIGWEPFKKCLSEILSFDDSFGISSKALDIMLEHEHVFCKARIITELRPVFKPNVKESPPAAVIVHELKITYHEGRTMKEFFAAMDSDEIRELQRTLDRAIQKEASLKSVVARAGLPCLEAKEE